RDVGLKRYSIPPWMCALQSDDEICCVVVAGIKGATVVNRQFFERAHLAGIVMAVRMSRIDDVLQVFFSELLVITFAERHLEKINRIIAQPVEILRPETWIEQHFLKQAVISIQILDVSSSREDRHF